MKPSRHYQRDLGIEQPVSVLWAALREHLTPDQLAAVEAAYKAQSQRYQRACTLNKMARWAHQLQLREPALGNRDRLVLERLKSILADPAAYIEGNPNA